MFPDDPKDSDTENVRFLVLPEKETRDGPGKKIRFFLFKKTKQSKCAHLKENGE